MGIEQVFQRSVAIVAACSAGYVTFTSTIISLDMFFLPHDLQNGVLWASRLSWITACLLLMYIFTPRFRSRAFNRSVVLGTALIAVAAAGLLVTSLIHNRYVLTYDVDHDAEITHSYKLLRPVELSSDIAMMVGTSSEDSVADQNDALVSNLAYGDRRAREIADQLAEDNLWIAAIYWVSTYIGITFSFIGVLIIAWTVAVVRR